MANAQDDLGSNVSDSLLAPDLTASYAGSPIQIPDYNVTGIASVLTLAGTAKVTAAEIEVHITHTYIGDLKVQLVCPSGATQVLSNLAGGSAHDLHQTFTVTACNGAIVGGDWKLKVSDTSPQDIGTLDAWTVRVKLDAPVTNHAPVANAGTAQSVTAGASVTLVGSGSDADGNPLTYRWSQTAGPTVTLGGLTTAAATFVAPEVTATTTLSFRLIANDGKVDSAAATVKVLVQPRSVSNITTITRSATDTPTAIPDATPAGIASTIKVDATGTVTSLTAEVHIAHSYIGDLKLALVCPDGTSSILQSQVGGSTDNLDKTFTVTACNAKAAGGNYTLKVSDFDAQDTGTLSAWKLTVGVVGDSGISGFGRQAVVPHRERIDRGAERHQPSRHHAGHGHGRRRADRRGRTRSRSPRSREAIRRRSISHSSARPSTRSPSSPTAPRRR